MSQPDPGNRPEEGPRPPWGTPPQWGQPQPGTPPQWGQPQPGTPPQWGQPQPGTPPQWGQPQWGTQPQWGAPQYPGQGWGAPVDPRWPAGGPPPYGQPRYVAPPKPGIVPLRPLFFGEIMDGAFQTIRRNAKTMFGSALIVRAVTGALSMVAALGMLGMVQPPVGGFTSQDEAMRYLGPIMSASAGILGISLLTMVLEAILQGVMAIPVARSALNRPTGFKQMWSLARSRIWPLVGLASLLLAGSLLFFVVLFVLAALILTGLGPAGALLLLPLGFGALVVFIWIYTKLLVAPAAVTVEELGVFAGLRRSWALTTRNWWRIFGITLLVAFMVGIIGSVIQIPLSLASGGVTSVFAPHAGASQLTTTAIVLLVVSQVVAVLISAVGFAFQTSVAALIYMDLRMRRDGLDVELLRLLETGEDPDGVPGRRRTPQAGPRPWPPATGQGFPTG